MGKDLCPGSHLMERTVYHSQETRSHNVQKDARWMCPVHTPVPCPAGRGHVIQLQDWAVGRPEQSSSLEGPMTYAINAQVLSQDTEDPSPTPGILHAQQDQGTVPTANTDSRQIRQMLPLPKAISLAPGHRARGWAPSAQAVPPPPKVLSP